MPSVISLIASLALTARAEEMEAPEYRTPAPADSYRSPGVYIEEIAAGPRPVGRRRPEALDCQKHCTANRDEMWNSIYCKACRKGKDMQTFCTDHYANNMEQCLKYKVADSVCVLAGEMNSLGEGLQVDDSDNDCFVELGYGSAIDLATALQDGSLADDARRALNRCWSDVVGGMSNFGASQWALGYYFARSKKELGDALDNVFGAMETHTGGRRRLADGYAANKAGTSTVLGMLNPNSDVYVGNPLERCDAFLKETGSGLENPGQPCEIACDSTAGFCDYCGTGKCCKNGENDSACSGTEGGEDRYTCVPAYTNPGL